MKRKITKQGWGIAFGVGGAVLALVVVWLGFVSSSDPQSFEGVQTRLLDQARRVCYHAGFVTAAKYFDSKFEDSRLQDLYAEADLGRRVKKVTFAKSGASIGGVGVQLRQWATEEGVKIFFTFSTSQRLVLYVRASDEPAITDYLGSLSPEALHPFE